MLSFVEQLIRASYNLNDLLWYFIAKHKILFLQDRAPLFGPWHVLRVLFSLAWRPNVLMDLQLPTWFYSSTGDESICTKLQCSRVEACHPQLEA